MKMQVGPRRQSPSPRSTIAAAAFSTAGIFTVSPARAAFPQYERKPKKTRHAVVWFRVPGGRSPFARIRATAIKTKSADPRSLNIFDNERDRPLEIESAFSNF